MIGQHIQHTGIADNLNYVWQRDLATSIKTVGHRLGELGYHAAYQGKWHLSANLDLSAKAIDAPLRAYRDTIASYGFKDFFGVGDLIDGVQWCVRSTIGANDTRDRVDIQPRPSVMRERRPCRDGGTAARRPPTTAPAPPSAGSRR